jgi:ferrous iron transport protein A
MVRAHFNLSELSEGQSATIRDIDLSSPTAERLLDLGFTPGTPITAIRRAPLGDPCTFLVRGYRIGLRNAEARLIHIDPTGIS